MLRFKRLIVAPNDRSHTFARSLIDFKMLHLLTHKLMTDDESRSIGNARLTYDQRATREERQQKLARASERERENESDTR